MNLSLIKLMGTFPQEYPELEWGVCCVLITLDYKIRELFGKAGFNPLWITYTTKSRRDWRRCKTNDLHIEWMGCYWCSWLEFLPWKGYSGCRPDVLVDCADMRGPLSCIGHTGWGIRCLWFRSDLERTCKWMVCLTLDFILCWLISIKYTSAW